MYLKVTFNVKIGESDQPAISRGLTKAFLVLFDNMLGLGNVKCERSFSHDATLLYFSNISAMNNLPPCTWRRLYNNCNKMFYDDLGHAFRRTNHDLP